MFPRDRLLRPGLCGLSTIFQGSGTRFLYTHVIRGTLEPLMALGNDFQAPHVQDLVLLFQKPGEYI